MVQKRRTLKKWESVEKMVRSVEGGASSRTRGVSGEPDLRVAEHGPWFVSIRLQKCFNFKIDGSDSAFEFVTGACWHPLLDMHLIF
ncbi:hypothetical protein L1049_000683 [Liquidambar formosana]|uniref:Uncharacterized protein n=1 Tax=Liquidambar formosana TaxID=63359 RepID=A0AAP0R5J6_LIQFO